MGYQTELEQSEGLRCYRDFMDEGLTFDHEEFTPRFAFQMGRWAARRDMQQPPGDSVPFFMAVLVEIPSRWVPFFLAGYRSKQPVKEPVAV